MLYCYLENYFDSILKSETFFPLDDKGLAKAMEFKKEYLNYVSQIDSANVTASKAELMLKDELYKHWTEGKDYNECAKAAEEKINFYLSE